jgi:hypothetical protein
MANGATDVLQVSETTPGGRVLLFTVDDGLFSVQLDRVEGVYARERADVHTVKARSGRPQSFIVHGDQPAFVLDVRDAFDLSGILGETRRDALVVVRSGSYLFAIQADACVGVKELDLRGQVPIASSVVRDGGLSVGHLVEQDGAIVVVLDPNRLLDANVREALEPAARDARAFAERQRKVEVAWQEIRTAPTAAAVRTFARVCRRTGRGRAATAARLVLKFLEAGAAGVATVPAETPSERTVRDLLGAALAARSGRLVLEGDDGRDAGTVFLDAGRIVDAEYPGEWGGRALRRILDSRSDRRRFVDGAVERDARLAGSTVASLIAALEAGGDERRARRER